MKKAKCVSIPVYSAELGLESLTVGKIYDVIEVEYRNSVLHSLLIEDDNLNRAYGVFSENNNFYSTFEDATIEIRNNRIDEILDGRLYK